METHSDTDMRQKTKVAMVKSYRKWSDIEMDALVQILLDLVGEGQKSDNGFRNGYLKTCVERLEVIFPRIKVTCENVRHRIQGWRKVYGQVKQIDLTSGMGFDAPNQRLTKVDNDVWNTYVKVHKDVAGFRNKVFPYYMDWKICFGNDQADGVISRNFTMAFEEIQNADPACAKRKVPETEVDAYYPDMSDIVQELDPLANPNIVVEEVPKNATTTKVTAQPSPGKKKIKEWALRPHRKPKPEDVAVGSITKLMEKFVEGSELRLKEIRKELADENTHVASAPAVPAPPVDNNPMKDADEIMTIVDGMELTTLQRILISSRIVMNPFYTKMFLRLNGEARMEFVDALASNKLP